MAHKPLEVVDARITGVRKMTKTEGAILYASQDGEGNGPGVVFGTTKTGTPFPLIAAKAAA